MELKKYIMHTWEIQWVILNLSIKIKNNLNIDLKHIKIRPKIATTTKKDPIKPPIGAKTKQKNPKIKFILTKPNMEYLIVIKHT